jgi:hypothetical protein
MPIRSQRLSMRFEDWELLPYQPGWKYEYWGGCAHITPNHQTAVTVAPVTPRSVTAPCIIRPARPNDETPLLAVYLAAFADNQAFCDYTDEKMHDAARRDLRESFTAAVLPCWRRHALRWPPMLRTPPSWAPPCCRATASTGQCLICFSFTPRGIAVASPPRSLPAP